MGFLLDSVCQHISNPFWRELLHNSLNGSLRIQPIIAVVLIDRCFNRITASNIGKVRCPICVHLTGFVGVVCHFVIDWYFDVGWCDFNGFCRFFLKLLIIQYGDLIIQNA